MQYVCSAKTVSLVSRTESRLIIMRGLGVIVLALGSLGVACWPRPGHAAPYPTGQLVPGCEDYLNSGEHPRDPTNALACRASIATVGDVLVRLRFACVPAGVSYQTIDRVVVQYARMHLKEWDQNFGSTIMEAYKATWPCH